MIVFLIYMKKRWQLQEAKNRLSAVVEEALQHGPQIITRRGVDTAVVISIKEFIKMTKPKQNLAEFFQSSPLHDVEIDLTRSKDPGPLDPEFCICFMQRQGIPSSMSTSNVLRNFAIRDQ